jgi:hypothetical protein
MVYTAKVHKMYVKFMLNILIIIINNYTLIISGTNYVRVIYDTKCHLYI